MACKNCDVCNVYEEDLCETCFAAAEDAELQGDDSRFELRHVDGEFLGNDFAASAEEAIETMSCLSGIPQNEITAKQTSVN